MCPCAYSPPATLQFRWGNSPLPSSPIASVGLVQPVRALLVPASEHNILTAQEPAAVWFHIAPCSAAIQSPTAHGPRPHGSQVLCALCASCLLSCLPQTSALSLALRCPVVFTRLAFHGRKRTLADF